MKFLIVGLGNIGSEYRDTRHNIGFMMADALAEATKATFSTQRYGDVAQSRVKSAQLVILKPSTYMNLSGEAVRYWKQKENIELENILILVDDIAIPFGTVRIKGKGSDGGHNGLKSINSLLGTEEYARLRFGVGNDFPKGAQIDYVLSNFTEEEFNALPDRLKQTTEAIKSFCLSGLPFTMTHFNNK